MSFSPDASVPAHRADWPPVKILIVGGHGQLATSLVTALSGDDVRALSHGELDICDAGSVTGTIARIKPDVVINTAAMRRPDECESAPDRAFAVNALGARNVALACKAANCALAHISTDYVFDDSKETPWMEDEIPNPPNVYGVTKLAGEHFVRQIVERFYIIRTSALFGGATDISKGSNFVLMVLKRAAEGLDTNVVTDQRMTPTYTPDLARKISWLIRREDYGVCHISNKGDCTWYEFARAIFDKAGLTTGLIPITTDALTVAARRLKYSVLGHGTLARLGADDMPHWGIALDRYLKELGRLRPAATHASLE